MADPIFRTKKISDTMRADALLGLRIYSLHPELEQRDPLACTYVGRYLEVARQGGGIEALLFLQRTYKIRKPKDDRQPEPKYAEPRFLSGWRSSYYCTFGARCLGVFNPPGYKILQLADPVTRKVIADWWEEHDKLELADLLRQPIDAGHVLTDDMRKLLACRREEL
jgi:hypothetical protein